MHIDIDRVEVYTASGGWQTLHTVDRQFNLMELADGGSVVLFVEELPAGHYTQMRVILGTDNWVSLVPDKDDDRDAIAVDTISGSLNINPSESKKNRFEMILDDGSVTDIVTLTANGIDWSFSGQAREVRVLPKGQGRTLKINDIEVVLPADTRSTISANTMTVKLYNTKDIGKSKGHFWIGIDATNATIAPNPGIPVDDSDKINITVPNVDMAVSLLNDFDISEGGTTVITLDFDLEKSIFKTDDGEYFLNPLFVVSIIDIDEKIVYFDDFGYGPHDADIPGWEEQESAAGEDKCSVEDGSSLGGRTARMYGEDLGVNHYYFREWDTTGYDGGRIVFWAKRSDEWSSLDRVFVEVLFEDAWHNLLSIGTQNATSSFSRFEIPLDSGMMKGELWIRFRNQIEDETQYLDIDNFEIYGFKR